MDSITKHIQAITLDILLHFDAVCKKNGLTYYLAYGSLLGGVRHQGFIPWDDDLDVWMPRAEYEKLLNLTKKETSEYALVSDYQSGDLPLVFQGKYANKSLVCDRDKFGETVKAYPWLDIFVLDVFPREQAKKYLKSVKRASVLFNLCRLRNISGAKKQSSGFRKLIFKANDIIHFFDLIGDKKIERMFLNKLTQFKQGDMYFCFATVYMNDLKKCTFNTDWFRAPVQGTFENYKFPFPSNADSVLTTIYNNYMVPPRPEKRIRAHEISNIREIEGEEV